MVNTKDWDRILKESEESKKRGIVIFENEKLEDKLKKGTITKGEKILLETKKRIEEGKKTGYIRIYERPITKSIKIKMDF